MAKYLGCVLVQRVVFPIILVACEYTVDIPPHYVVSKWISISQPLIKLMQNAYNTIHDFDST